MAQAFNFLTKDDIRDGSLLWLRSDADEIHPSCFKRSGLTKQALNHPALIIDALRPDHDYVLICTVSREP